MKNIAARKLNLGCGRYRKEGYINVDYNPLCKPDVLHDLNKIPYPFSDNYFDVIEADHCMEHLENPLLVMVEFHRILKDKGALIVKVPHFSRGFTHSDHKRSFDVSFPYYFNPLFTAGYMGVEFKLEKLKFRWLAQPYLKKQFLPAPVYYFSLVAGKVIDFFANLSPFICSRIWCYLVGGFEEMEIRFICKK